MSEQETPKIAQNAKPQPESKPNSAPKKSKSKTKPNKKKKPDSHAHRPKSSLTYWKNAIEGNKLKGEDLAYAIKRIEAHEKEKTQKKSAKAAPSNTLRAILNRDPKASKPKIEAQPVAEIAQNTNPQIDEVPLTPGPQIAKGLEKPLTFDDGLDQLAEQSRNSESVADIAKRVREVPTPEHDSRTETRIWAAVHGMRVR